MDINELTYQINGAVFEVNRELGAGFLEKVYQNALIVEPRQRGLRAEAQVPIVVKYKGETVGDYLADIVVEERIIVELKAVEQLQKVHEAQLLNYPRATGYKIGLLVNFTHRELSASLRRRIFLGTGGRQTERGVRGCGRA